MKDEFISKIGVWGQRHYNYLKKQPVLYLRLILIFLKLIGQIL